ncbi:MAG: Ni/Fe-hydrogenase cytochrome b subunit [Nitrospirae bacterium]|nr:MAG: Ni/Fe-hydrogenase cytochrome b subunit [Nitrospirota bacterium]
MIDESKPIGGKILTKPFMFFSAIAAIAAILLIKRFIFGIGAVTNLSDGYPWGIWIAYDVVVGTGLTCGGYAISLIVYVLNKGEYHPLIRPAVMASLFGYTLAGVSIFFDVGRYWQAYNPVLPKYAQVNSVMLEVALCVMAYIAVLWIEFTPVFAEKWTDKFRIVSRPLNKVLFVFIALGVLLPTMHQSSLGTLMVIAGKKLSPLWQTAYIPLLFLISAITMAYAVVIFESLISAIALKREMETPMLSKLSLYMVGLTVVYLIVRLGDILLRGKLLLAFNGDFKGFMFIVENLLFILPFFLLSSPSKRNNPKMLFYAAISMLLAGGLYRFDTFLIGFDPGPGWQYFPAFSEIMITLGLISIEIVGYMIFVKKLPVLPAVRPA